MKIQLVFLALFVVATMAHRHREGDDENQVGERRHYRGRRREDNQIAANAEDAELEDSVASDDDNIATERSHRRGCGSRRGGKRGERKGARRPESDTDFDVRHAGGSDDGENRHHDRNWHEKHGVPMPDGDSDEGRNHHRHHKHRHHHHHHHNRTTTSAPPTTTTETTEPSLFVNE